MEKKLGIMFTSNEDPIELSILIGKTIFDVLKFLFQYCKEKIPKNLQNLQIDEVQIQGSVSGRIFNYNTKIENIQLYQKEKLIIKQKNDQNEYIEIFGLRIRCLTQIVDVDLPGYTTIEQLTTILLELFHVDSNFKIKWGEIDITDFPDGLNLSQMKELGLESGSMIELHLENQQQQPDQLYQAQQQVPYQQQINNNTQQQQQQRQLIQQFQSQPQQQQQLNQQLQQNQQQQSNNNNQQRIRLVNLQQQQNNFNLPNNQPLFNLNQQVVFQNQQINNNQQQYINQQQFAIINQNQNQINFNQPQYQNLPNQQQQQVQNFETTIQIQDGGLIVARFQTVVSPDDKFEILFQRVQQYRGLNPQFATLEIFYGNQGLNGDKRKCTFRQLQLDRENLIFTAKIRWSGGQIVNNY